MSSDTTDWAGNATGVARFFDDFVAAFATFEGAMIAERYGTPYLACPTEGPVKLFGSRDEIVEYFQGVVDDYRDLGVRSCRYDDVDVVEMGRRCLLATVTWTLLDAEAQAVMSWRESYNLMRSADSLLVYASTDHTATS